MKLVGRCHYQYFLEHQESVDIYIYRKRKTYFIDVTDV